MPRRILIAELKQETATFNPTPTLYEDFRIAVGGGILEAYRGTKTELAGVIDVLDDDGRFEVVPAMAAASVSGGHIRKADLDRLLDEMLNAIREAGPVDGACLCFHGAMAGESEDDPEGRVLTDIRGVLGSVPIVVSLDLHAVITDRMVDMADVLVPYHTYPHTDHYETGQRAARNLIRVIDGESRPTVARVELPMLVRGDELLTATGKFGEAIRMCQQVEQSDKGLAAGVIIGNAFTDVPALQSNVLVTTDNDLELAKREAARIGRFMWDHREAFQARLTSLTDAIRQAESADGLVVFSDAADATASGAAGDSNSILRGLIEAGFGKRALLAIVDAPVVAAAFGAGVGADITVPVGGTRDPSRFTPITISGHVKSLHDGHFSCEDGTAARAGRVCVLAIEAIHILVTERPVFVVGQRVFKAHGLDPIDYDLVVVKSPNGFRTWYESMASLIVPVDVPGSTSANLKSLPFRKCVRPIFPLDDNVPSPFENN